MIGGLRAGGAIAVLGAVIWLGLQLREKARLELVEKNFKACEASAKAGSEAGSEPSSACGQALSDAVTRAQRYLLCDAGLKDGDAWRIRAGCSESMKRRDAQAAAAAATAQSLKTALAELKAGQTAAIQRAATRAAATARKEAHADAALSRAPRLPDDRIRCDDACLRDLTGQ